MVPEDMRGGIQLDVHTGHRQRLDREGGQTARHGNRHAGCPAPCSGHRFGRQKQERRDGLFRLPHGASASKRPADGAMARHGYGIAE